MNRQKLQMVGIEEKGTKNVLSLVHACRWVTRACSLDFRMLRILVMAMIL